MSSKCWGKIIVNPQIHTDLNYHSNNEEMKCVYKNKDKKFMSQNHTERNIIEWNSEGKSEIQTVMLNKQIGRHVGYISKNLLYKIRTKYLIWCL